MLCCDSGGECLIFVKGYKNTYLKDYEMDNEAEERGRGQSMKGLGCLVEGLMNNFEQEKWHH